MYMYVSTKVLYYMYGYMTTTCMHLYKVSRCLIKNELRYTVNIYAWQVF